MTGCIADALGPDWDAMFLEWSYFHERALVSAHRKDSKPWNWRQDVVEDLERRGLIKVEHGRHKWSVTEAGRTKLGELCQCTGNQACEICHTGRVPDEQ